MIVEILVLFLTLMQTLQCCTITLILTVNQKNPVLYYVKEIPFYL